MPDADDFDVEYFRKLLKGGIPQEETAPPVEPSPRVAEKRARLTCRPAASKKTGNAAGVRRKDMNR